MNEQRLPPGILFRSFLLVGAAFTVCSLSNLIFSGLYAWLFFPETFEFWTREEHTEEAIVAQAHLAMPAALFWLVAGTATLIAGLVGYAVTRWAPFGQRGHAIFLAMILLVWLLQSAVSCPAPFRWMVLLMMGFYSVAVLLGAQLRLRSRPSDETNGNQESEESPSPSD